MKKTSSYIPITLAVLAMALFAWYAYHSNASKKISFEKENAVVAAFAATTADRVGSAVLTLPETTTLAGLKNGYAQFTSTQPGFAGGVVTLNLSQMKTYFVQGEFGKTKPRLDALVPMYIAGDSYDTSMYVTLFQDRGDAALEKSYVRLGRSDVTVLGIYFLPKEEGKMEEEYRVDITFKKEGADPKTHKVVSKQFETIIPVVDGHFDPAGTVNKP